MLVNTVIGWYSGVRSEEQQTIGSPGQYRAYASLSGRSPSSASISAALDS